MVTTRPQRGEESDRVSELSPDSHAGGRTGDTAEGRWQPSSFTKDRKQSGSRSTCPACAPVPLSPAPLRPVPLRPASAGIAAVGCSSISGHTGSGCPLQKEQRAPPEQQVPISSSWDLSPQIPSGKGTGEDTTVPPGRRWARDRALAGGGVQTASCPLSASQWPGRTHTETCILGEGVYVSK